MATLPRLQRPSQHPQVQPEHGVGVLHVLEGGYDFRGPWFRTDEAAAYLQYRGRHARRSLYRFIQKQGIKTSRRFRTVLVSKASIDRAIGASKSVTHA